MAGTGEQVPWSAIAAEDKAALDELVERSYRVVYRVLAQMCRGDAARAADLTQETYRRAWAAIARFEGRAAITTWLCRIAYNVFIEDARRRRDLVDLPDGTALPEPRDPHPGALETLTHDEEARALRRAVLALPDELRFPVVARFWGDAPVEEIARVLGITGMGVRKRLSRAMKAIEAQLAQENRR